MSDEKQFMEMLSELIDVARASGNIISTKEIDEYFEDMDLNDAQREAIYDYLHKGNIRVTGYIVKMPESDVPEKAAKPVSGSKAPEKIVARTQNYKNSVRELSVDKDTLAEIHRGLLLYEDETIKERAIHAYLPVVVNIASKYSDKGVHIDELIQEGNLALIMVVEELAGNTEIQDYDRYIRDKIRDSIIKFIDAELETEGRLAAAMAKAGLVYEASKHLAETMGKVASIQELSDFTHVPVEEIEEIIKFSGDSITVERRKENT